MKLLFLLLLSFNVHAMDAELMISIIECESSGKHDAVGDGGASRGIAQFRKETFYELSSEAGFRNYYYNNPIHQLRVMNWAIEHGYGDRWTCYRKIQDELNKLGE